MRRNNWNDVTVISDKQEDFFFGGVKFNLKAISRSKAICRFVLSFEGRDEIKSIINCSLNQLVK